MKMKMKMKKMKRECSYGNIRKKRGGERDVNIMRVDK